ncbi:class I SAM-dependent methyltransferase, partial [Listeria monocytogenes]|nr:class I SAM-dependent methyltransferase [Listeria monocytogenes]
MANEATQELFQVLDNTAIILQNELEISYLEAVYETGENLFQKEVLQKEELSSEKQLKLQESYESIELENFSNEEIRKG